MAFDADLTLLYQFDTDKALTSVNSLGPTLTFARSTAATYHDSAGVIQTAATGVARFDHTPLTPFTSLGLLVEIGRTNLCPESADLGTSWTVFQSVLATDNTTSPDGGTNADKITDDNVGGRGSCFVQISFGGFTVDSNFVFSLYAKADQNDWVRFKLNSLASLDIFAYFDLTNGVVGATKGANNTSEFIEDVGNGWFRCGIVFASDSADTTGQPQIFIADANNDHSVARDTTSSIFVWGVQVEEGTFPTSYIPTVGGSLARNPDEVSTTTLDWLDTAATAVGTWYVRAQFPVTEAVANALVSLDDGGVTDRFYFERDAAENINFTTTHNADTDGLVSGTAVIAIETEFELGASYIDDDIVMAVDNTLETADTTAAIPVGDNPVTLHIGADSGGNYWNGHIAEVRYYNVQKNDTFVQQLSNGEITETAATGINTIIIVPTGPPIS